MLAIECLQITITAALGFDSFLVMRHGAGPFNSNHGLKDEAVNAVSTDLGNINLADRDGRQRLGCYFCNDVVAPIDVISYLCNVFDILGFFACQLQP